MTCKPAPFSVLVGWEVRRLWRGVVPWLFAAAVPGVFVAAGNWQAPALERHKEMLLYVALVNTALSAFTAWTIQRDRRAGTDEVILAWPVASWRLYLARTLALASLTAALWLEAALLALGYTAFSYAAAAHAAGLPLPLVDALRDGGLIALSLAASFLGAQAAGQLAAALLPGLAGLVALVLYRAFSFAGPRLILGILQWPYALLASPELQWEGWARLVQYLHHGLYVDAFVAHQAFWVVASLGALVLLACLFQAQRDRPRLHSAAIAAGALVVVATAALPFIAVERGYTASHARSIATYGEAVKPGLRPSNLPFVAHESAAQAPMPLRYRLALDLTRPPEVRIEATLEMAAGPDVPQGSLTLTLRRAFAVDEVRLDGAPSPFVREGDLLRLQPAQPLPSGQPFAVSLRYHGPVADWRLDPYETPAALAAPRFIWLPSTWGWYPVPGEHRLTWEIGMTSMVARALADPTVPFNSAEPAFDVSVRAPVGVRTLIGFAQDANGIWRLQQSRNQVTLLGGDWWLCGEGAVRFAVPFEELDTWQASTADVQRLFEALANWTGIAPLTVVPSPVRFTNAGDVSLILDSDVGSNVYQAAPGRAYLTSRTTHLVFSRLLFFRSLPSLREGEPGSPSYAVGEAVDSLRRYAVGRALEDAFGTAAVPSQYSTASAVTTPVEAWVARTPREVQMATLRRLFHDALLRPLTPADLAFLDGGGTQ